MLGKPKMNHQFNTIRSTYSYIVRDEYLIAIGAIHIILNIVTYIFYFVGIICQGRKWYRPGE